MSLPSFKNSRQVREHTLAGIKAFSERQSRKEEKFTELETCIAALENDIFLVNARYNSLFIERFTFLEPRTDST